MKNVLKTELKKAFGNIWFFIALAIGCALAIVSAADNFALHYTTSIMGIEYIESKWVDFSASSCFKYWMVVDFIQPATGLFFLLLPLLAVLPYAWSYCVERKSGYVGNAVTRTSRTTYFFAKYGAVFLSGGSVITIPIILNFIVCACLMPARMPDIYSVIYFGIFEESLWSGVFYTNPFLYCLLFTGMNFAFAGLWAAVTYALSFYIKNRIVLTIAPFLFLLFVKFLHENVFLGIIRTEITPFGFLRGPGVDYSSNGFLILSVLLLLLAFSVITTYRNRQKDIL